jgi:hypothetical protein
VRFVIAGIVLYLIHPAAGTWITAGLAVAYLLVEALLWAERRALDIERNETFKGPNGNHEK